MLHLVHKLSSVLAQFEVQVWSKILERFKNLVSGGGGGEVFKRRGESEWDRIHRDTVKQTLKKKVADLRLEASTIDPATDVSSMPKDACAETIAKKAVEAMRAQEEALAAEWGKVVARAQADIHEWTQEASADASDGEEAGPGADDEENASWVQLARADPLSQSYWTALGHAAKLTAALASQALDKNILMPECVPSSESEQEGAALPLLFTKGLSAKKSGLFASVKASNRFAEQCEAQETCWAQLAQCVE
jgi:hypothetical protein